MTASYPISDHFDGQRFFNPGVAPSSRSLGQVLRWQMRREARAVWPTGLINPPFPPPQAVVERGTVAITYINHASFLIRLPGTLILTDPIFSDAHPCPGLVRNARARPASP